MKLPPLTRMSPPFTCSFEDGDAVPIPILPVGWMVMASPLIVPDGCEFRVGGETRKWNVGEAFAFDDTIEHEAWNRSAEDRAVLIMDVWNPHLSEHERTMVCRLYEAADKQRSPLG